MKWMIATIDTRSALQKSGAVKVKVVQSSPSQDMLRQLTPDQKLQKGLDEMRGEYRTAVRGYVREICYGEIHDTDYGDYEIMLHIEDRLYGLLEEPLWTITQRNMIQTTIDECSELEDKEWERYRKYG